MKSILIVLIFVITVDAELNLNISWEKFLNDHNKIYSSSREKASRFQIFKDNVAKIEEHNAKYERGETTYYKGINQFTDMTMEELSEKYLVNITHPTKRNNARIVLDSDVPESKNWTAEGVVTNVKNQKTCGCCYAFAAVAAIESGNAIVNKKLINLSVQQMVDCSNGDTYLNYGCRGGIIEGSIHYVMDHGIEAEESYPYESRAASCRANETLNVVSVKSYENVDADEDLLKAAVGKIGPVAAAVDAYDWFSYEGGIIDGSCSGYTSHVILIAGYGTENGIDYWYIKNSWGPEFGLNGYLKIRRNNNNAFCISTFTAYPVMK